jgi:hypothetical protein
MNRNTWRQRLLRAIRSVLAAAIAWGPRDIPGARSARSSGCAARRRAVRGCSLGLYWFVQERFIARLQRGGERFRPVSVLGRRLQLDITDATGRYPFFYGTPYEPAVTDAIATALKPGDVFIDVGANIGYFTVLAAHLVGSGGRVIAFEPHEGCARRSRC